MALVEYSSSDEEDDNSQTEAAIPSQLEPQSSPTLKRKRDEPVSNLPPLPSKFHDLYASTVRTSTRDDPNLHGGRKRVAPHVEGNWPTHIYIEWYPSTIEHDTLSRLISDLREGTTDPAAAAPLHSFLSSELGAPLPLHISLSRPIGFLTEQRDAFATALEDALRTSGVRPFDVSFLSLDWVSNFEHTRWFLVLRLRAPEADGLNRLLHLSNAVVQRHGQPPLYVSPTLPPNMGSSNPWHRRGQTVPRRDRWHDMQDRSDAFHVSIAWTLEQPPEGLLERTEVCGQRFAQDLERMRIRVEDVKCKVGNVVSSLELPRKVTEGEGLFGT